MDWTTVRNGMPQGLITSLLLYMCYINDPTGICKSTTMLYADDFSVIFIEKSENYN